MRIAQGFPSQSAPFVGPDGRVTQVWYNYLISLFDRSGGPRGVDTAVLVTQVQEAMAVAEGGYFGVEDGRAAAALSQARDAISAASGGVFLGLEDGRLAALQLTASQGVQSDGLLYGVEDGRIAALTQASALDPALAVLMFGDAR